MEKGRIVMWLALRNCEMLRGEDDLGCKGSPLQLCGSYATSTSKIYTKLSTPFSS